jgi:hypothetical protein
MKISEDKTFNLEFPEKYSWGHADSVAASNIGFSISACIEHEIRKNIPENRILTPGLRKALILIAEYFNA